MTFSAEHRYMLSNMTAEKEAIQGQATLAASAAVAKATAEESSTQEEREVKQVAVDSKKTKSPATAADPSKMILGYFWEVQQLLKWLDDNESVELKVALKATANEWHRIFQVMMHN